VVLRLEHKAVEDIVDGLADEGAVHHELAWESRGGSRGAGRRAGSSSHLAAAAQWEERHRRGAQERQPCQRLVHCGGSIAGCWHTIDTVQDGLQVVALPRILCTEGEGVTEKLTGHTGHRWVMHEFQRRPPRAPPGPIPPCACRRCYKCTHPALNIADRNHPNSQHAAT
jgi:hypothetical protein